MPAITISAVNTGTDTITATAHGLLTGDRFRLRNVGGALPAATPSLAAVTDYFALRVDADNLKVCDTNAHALAATGIIDITGSGSGTTTVEFGLPYAIPNAIAAPGTQVKSADLNGTWNSLVSLYDLLTGQAQSIWTLVTLAVSLVVNGTLTVTGLFSPSGGIGPMIYASISPSALSAGNNNNYNPTGLSTAVIVRITTAGGFPFLTGIAGGASGRMLYLYNVGADTITISHQDGSSSSGNQFLTPTGASLSLATNQSMTWMYDSTSSKWRLVAKNF